jgi:hypothetical protein
MPVLDSKALKTDPHGSAFLLGVLRRTPSTPKDAPKTGTARIDLIKRRVEFLDRVSGS